MRDAHADGADGEDGLAANAVDVEHGWDGSDEHDDADDTCREQGGSVAGQAKLTEDRWGVVKNCNAINSYAQCYEYDSDLPALIPDHC